MLSTVLVGLLLLSQLVTAQVTIIESPSNVTACFGGEARFSCFVEFTSGQLSGAIWRQNGVTDVSSPPVYMVFDNSSSGSSPAVVNNTLLITNVSATGINPDSTYLCVQAGMMSNPATLSIIGPPTGTIIPGIRSFGSGSSNSITLSLSYGNSNDPDDSETITGISLSWRDSTGSTSGAIVLDSNTSSYTIMGLTPSTTYNITLIAINQCGNGPVYSFDGITESGTVPNSPMPSQTITMIAAATMTTNAATTTPNPSNTPGSGAAAGIECNIITLLSLLTAVVMVMI